MKSKLIYGVGINDADYAVNTTDSTGKQSLCPFYRTWNSMLQRCYDKKYQSKKPTYKGCSVSNDWLTFSNFKAWMESQDYKGNQLDKDLLIQGNKVYSPTTSIFVSGKVNNFLIERCAVRGLYPIGVFYMKKSKGMVNERIKPYRARVRDGYGKLKSLGCFSTPEEAHQAWLKAKLELAKELAAEQADPRVAKALVERYENFKEG